MDVFKKIEIEYQQIRDKNQRENERRIKKIYREIPEIEEVDKYITKIGIRGSREQLLNPSSESLMKLNEEIYSLKKEKENLLMQNGYLSDYLDVQYDCTLCKDTGKLEDGSRCTCFKNKISQELYYASNINYALTKENFTNFDIKVFSDQKFEDEELTPRENITEILNVSRRFIDTFNKDNDFNMLFYGSTGQGKTFMLNCIAKELLDKSINVIYQTAFNILDIVENKRFRHSEMAQMKYDMLFEAELLIIDDLGIEMINSFSTSEIFNIVNTRLISAKKTLISTNLSPKELSGTYTDRVFSRVFQKFVPLKFYGEDLRLR